MAGGVERAPSRDLFNRSIPPGVLLERLAEANIARGSSLIEFDSILR